MSNVAHLPIEADRYGACVRQIYLRGINATGLSMRAQVRPAGDTPGPPLIDLQTVTNANAEGLRLVEVTIADGVPTSHVELVINETTLETLPYLGEVGSPTELRWDWQMIVANRKRRIARGAFTITGDGVTGADNAPEDRPPSWLSSSAATSGMRTGATLTFGDESVAITIDGTDLLAPMAEDAKGAAVRAESAAASIDNRAGYGAYEDALVAFTDRDGNVFAHINDHDQLNVGNNVFGSVGGEDLALLAAAGGEVYQRVDRDGGHHLPGLAGSVQDQISALGGVRGYRLYTFVDADTPNWRLRAYRCSKRTGLFVEEQVTHTGLPAGLTVRDPAPKPMGGRTWLVHTAYGYGTGAGASKIGLAVALNGLDFKHVALVDVAAMLPNAQSAWASELTVDQGGRIRLFVSVWLGASAKNDRNQDTKVFKTYWLYPTRPDLTAWALGGEVAGAALPANAIDVNFAFYNGFYWMPVKDELTRRLKLCWSTSITGPYDDGRPIVLGNTSVEGGELTIEPSGRFWLLFDQYEVDGVNQAYSDDMGVTWSPPRRVTISPPVVDGAGNHSPPRHGSLIAI